MENIIQKLEDMHKKIEQLIVKELTNDDILPIDTDFFKVAWNKIIQLRKDIDKIPDKKVRQNIIQNIIFMKEDLKNLIYIRLSKIIRNLIHTDFQSMEDKLSEIEKRIVLSMFRSIEEYFPEKRKPEEITFRNFILILFLKKYPVILASDGKSYGPFEVGDIACLPSPDAKFLIRKRVAKRLDEAN